MTRFSTLLFVLVPSTAFAQSSVVEDVTSNYGSSRWQVGAGASISDSPYAGEGTRITPVPWISYEGRRIFWRGVSGGVHVFDGDAFTFDAVAAGRFDGFDIGDLDRRQLERNGLDPSLLEDRDSGLDVGVAANWRGRAGDLKLQALADATDSSGGYEVSIDYGYSWQLGETVLITSVGASWLSRDTVRYYYGTLDEEEARGVTAYRPDAALVPQVQLGFVRPLGEKWRLFGSLSYRFLPDEITDSPFLERDSSGYGNLKIGFARSF